MGEDVGGAERKYLCRGPKTGAFGKPCFKKFGHPQTCVYPDVCLGIAHVSGKVPLPGQGVWSIHNVSALFALQIAWGERGRYIVYLPDPLSGRGTLPDAWAIPKHTSG